MRVRLGHNSGQGFVEDESLTPSERGYDYQHRLTLALLRRFAGFSTVTFENASGLRITERNYRSRGPDGGMDLVIRVDGVSEAARRAMRTRVKTIILNLPIDGDV